MTSKDFIFAPWTDSLKRSWMCGIAQEFFTSHPLVRWIRWDDQYLFWLVVTGCHLNCFPMNMKGIISHEFCIFPEIWREFRLSSQLTKSIIFQRGGPGPPTSLLMVLSWCYWYPYVLVLYRIDLPHVRNDQQPCGCVRRFASDWSNEAAPTHHSSMIQGEWTWSCYVLLCHVQIWPVDFPNLLTWKMDGLLSDGLPARNGMIWRQPVPMHVFQASRSASLFSERVNAWIGFQSGLVKMDIKMI